MSTGAKRGGHDVQVNSPFEQRHGVSTDLRVTLRAVLRKKGITWEGNHVWKGIQENSCIQMWTQIQQQDVTKEGSLLTSSFNQKSIHCCRGGCVSVFSIHFHYL